MKRPRFACERAAMVFGFLSGEQIEPTRYRQFGKDRIERRPQLAFPQVQSLHNDLGTHAISYHPNHVSLFGGQNDSRQRSAVRKT
jgi:hypothetical protein